MSITVITPSLPSRAQLLAEACASVATQELLPEEHLIAVDYQRKGSGRLRNELAVNARSQWLAFLDDDDVLLPNHLGLLADAVSHTQADIVYSFCEVTGRDGWTPNEEFDAETLRERNFIPVTVLIRAKTFRHVQGFPDSRLVENGWEDWALWLRLLDEGARFLCVPEVTWTYRFHEGNKTWAGEMAAA